MGFVHKGRTDYEKTSAKQNLGFTHSGEDWTAAGTNIIN